MFNIDSKTLNLIEKSCKGNKHIKLTVGFIDENSKDIKLYNESGEINSKQNHIYEIGSITKTFTTSLLSKYIFENKMSLDDSIEKYISGLNSEKYFPTLRHLATHTSGYPQKYPLNTLGFLRLFIDMIFVGNIQKINPLYMDLHKMKEIMEQCNLENKVYKFKYSNFGLSLLGYAIGQVSGKGYVNTMNEFLTNDLCLNNTYVGTVPNKNLKGYNTKNTDCGNWVWNEYNLVAPAGSISSTAEDLLEYARINMFDEKPYLNLCHQNYASGGKKHDMGLGWWLQKNNNIIGHGGGTGCFSSFLLFDKSRKIAFVVLSNYRLSMELDEKIAFSLLENFNKK